MPVRRPLGCAACATCTTARRPGGPVRQCTPAGSSRANVLLTSARYRVDQRLGSRYRDREAARAHEPEHSRDQEAPCLTGDTSLVTEGATFLLDARREDDTAITYSTGWQVRS